ncbi:MAG: DUF116 domain-containing protein [Terracidiphilus sp.]
MQVPSQPVPAPILPPRQLPDPIYDLRLTLPNSGGFYADVARFSHKLLAEAEFRAMVQLREYSDYVQFTLREPPRTLGEYSIELLTLGLAFSRYGRAAEATPGWAVGLARQLFKLRHASAYLKPVVDALRARLIRVFFMRHIALAPIPYPNYASRMLDALPRLIAWLQATGEFEQEALRLNNWRSYLHSLPRPRAIHCIEIATGFFEWFRDEANEALGAYTRGVPAFLANEYNARGCREDQLFCGRKPVEYHLCMVAAEIMNRGLRADFESKTCKVVLAPACMRGPYADFCRARTSGTDIKCAACSPGCAVNKLTRRLRAMGATVFLVPHSTGFSRWLERWQREPDTGVAAVACLLNILPGGYEMRARNIASQCVPLDFPGCQKHWRHDEIATSFNQDQLVQLLTTPSH